MSEKIEEKFSVDHPLFKDINFSNYDTARDAAAEAQNRWIRLVPDSAAGFYRVLAALGDLDPPTWPKLSMQQILEIAFQGRIIDSPDHPIVRRLRGLV